jgi:hypothetical protein
MRLLEYTSWILTHIASRIATVPIRTRHRAKGLAGDLPGSRISIGFQNGPMHMLIGKPGIAPSGLVALFLSTYLGVIPNHEDGERQHAIECDSPV